MSLKFEKLTFTPMEGVTEAIQKNLVIPYAIKKHNVAEVIAEKTRKKEQLIELNKLQGNLGLMGTAKSLIEVKEGIREITRIFFNCHIFVKEDALIPALVQMYQPVLQTFLNASNLTNEKSLKDAVKALDKRDPRTKIGTFLLNLKPFPAENIENLTPEEFTLANDLFQQFIDIEGNIFWCPFDGQPMVKMYEDKYGIKFCSEECKRRYYFLLYNTTKRESYKINLNGVAKDYSSYGSLLDARITEMDFHPIQQPNICVFCGNAREFTPSEVNKINIWLTHKQSNLLPKGVTLTMVAKIHQRWVVPICSSCRAYFRSLEVTPKGLKCKFNEKEMQGIKLQDATKNTDLRTRSTIPFIEITTPNKYLMWHLYAMNPFLSLAPGITSFLVSLTEPDPKSAFDWMEHRCMSGWPALFEEMRKNRIQAAEGAMGIFGGGGEE